ncbi:MAG: TetR/AcrR family transcriptional regulator [Myxococcota bacterium]
MSGGSVRDRILDAAVRLVEKKGAKGFGQVKVAHEAGLKQGHLTYYFPRKTDLVAGVIQRITQKLRSDVVGLLSTHVDPARREALLFDIVRRLLLERGRAWLLIGLVAESAEDDQLRRELAEGLRVQRELFARLVGRSPDDDEVRLAMAR